jgi:CheY-like chemotaxis protein
MNAILGLTDLIQHDKKLPEDIQSKIENIQKSSEHLLTIINDLLDYSQISAGALRVISEPFDLHETLRTAYTILEPRALTKPLRYSIDIGPDVPHWILGDRHRLTQVLVNLLGNAIKFTGTGHVEMICRFEETLDVPEHGILHVEVNDTGIGISSENLHKLFEGFVQADSSIALRFGGNGLGLSITRNLIEAMGGSIGVESILGQGSRFFFTLPCQASAPTHPVISSDNLIEAQGPIRILVVDDNPLNRQIASLQLRRQLIQAEIEQAQGGQQALEMIRTGRFDVVLLDLLMPDMDGFETTQKVRNELPEPQCRTPIIALTANNDAHEHARCLSVGMNETMIKPFDRLLLCKKVLEHARRTV